MRLAKILTVVVVLSLLGGNAWAADVILNEYNAVTGSEYLNGGNASADESGGRAFDSYFGRVMGNGGDWFEMVVITDHLDMRGWQLDIYENRILDETLTLTAHDIWSDLRSGTIITVAEDVPSDISYDPAAGDWWINVQARDDVDGRYIENSSFPVSSNNWQLRIRDTAGQVVFGPAGEGISPATGVGGTEIFRLETDPSVTVTQNSTDYDDGSDFSTFGAPNRWGAQDLGTLRSVVPRAPATITVLAPNGEEAFAGGDLVTIRWTSEDVNEPVLVEFSIDDGITWTGVYPPNVGNDGQYQWLVPLVDSDVVLIRVASSTRLSVYDVSNLPFSVLSCPLQADLTGDCLVNFFDFEILAAAWLE
jgi:hypothetical protein